MAKKKVTKKALSKKSKKTTKTATKKKTAKKAAMRKSGTAKKVATKKKTTVKASASNSAPRAVVHVGQVVPDFELPATGNKTIRLSDLKNKRKVLFFYPKDMTPGCTIEGRDFTQLKEQFLQHNTEVYGISRDSIKSHEKFKEKECYTIDLLSDEDEKVCNLFGVIKDKNMYGKIVRGIERSTFVIDENGVLVKEWRGVKVPDHAKEVLAFIQGQQYQK